MALSKREKKIMIVTIALLVVFIAVRFRGAVSLPQGGLPVFGAPDEAVEVAAEEARRVKSVLDRAPEVQAFHARTVSRNVQPVADLQRAENEFALALDNFIRRLGIELDEIKPASSEPVEDMQGYFLLTIEASMEKGWEDLVSLFNIFEDNWFLIRELSITRQMRYGSFKVDITLARVVRYDPSAAEAAAEGDAEVRPTPPPVDVTPPPQPAGPIINMSGGARR